ncbi:sulfur carrier protein ThiS [Variovorax sp. J22R133]|uniref:sulfur carrier protein ThiS n=1 Tax=Variovorax brevis TaxID=3053503 RepID=UPI002578EED0|nr:sulfur carrier protein ThiS [Variovorax sp. J22R133]MDM0111134.1 sulfur carrier protein ThiS [Variovorax sp. J22R133]
MKVLINDTPHELASNATLPDALQAIQATPPFAVAINREFVPRSQYPARVLRPDDSIEVIRPVTGG